MTVLKVKGAISDLEISFEDDRHALGPRVFTDIPLSPAVDIVGKNQEARITPKDGRMIDNALCHEVSSKTRHEDASTRTDAQRRPSPALCDVMLKSLTRDNQLRRQYVQRRWQGLVDCHDECRERETILANAPRR